MEVKQKRTLEEIMAEAWTMLLEGGELLDLYRTIKEVPHQTIVGNAGVTDLRMWIPLPILARAFFS
jgi:hypothetical protein